MVLNIDHNVGFSHEGFGETQNRRRDEDTS